MSSPKFEMTGYWHRWAAAVVLLALSAWAAENSTDTGRPGVSVRASVSSSSSARPGCSTVLGRLQYPCACAVLAHELLALDCDHVIFQDSPSLVTGGPIAAFSQRFTANEALPTHAFARAGVALRKIDVSSSSIRRLGDEVFSGLKDSLEEIRLYDNLLGDSLNPIFSSIAFHDLRSLRVLDLRMNRIRALEEGLLKGCKNLQELWLGGNLLTDIPSTSLNGPVFLRLLSLKDNRIGSLKDGSLQSQKNLEIFDLSGNRITVIEAGSFAGLQNLKILILGRNRLTKLNSDTFLGAENVIKIDLSENFLTEFPTVALKHLTSLKYLNLSSNQIERLDQSNLTTVTALQFLDLSRNNIGNISPGTFLGLNHLRHLDLSVNTIRTIEDDAFEGLNSLETLSLKDNNILLVPASALGRLPRLSTLNLDFNRVTALSSEILRAVADRVSSLTLARNVVRELPSDAFQDFKNLKTLDLNGNLLLNIEISSFTGLEDSLKTLILRGNRLSSLPSKPLSLQKLENLDLSENRINDLPRTSFMLVPSLSYLNLSHNPHLTAIPPNAFHPLATLEVLDLSHNNMRILSAELFMKLFTLRSLSLAFNSLRELTESAFQNLHNLVVIDLSGNQITNIRQGCFSSLTSLKKMNLSGNKLASFRGELFITRRSNGTQLEELDLSNNELTYLSPSSFRVHPRLKYLSASNNKFGKFPAELVVTLHYLQVIDLGGNFLKSVEAFEFGRLRRLRDLRLCDNELESISETAFHNSTQLQYIDLSGNMINRLGERTFQGLGKIKELNLANNLLSELPDSIFERSRLRMLETINLEGNEFVLPPLKTLQHQYSFLSKVNLAKNKISNIPSDDMAMINIKKLDLSFNPLTQESINNVLGETKLVRELNLAGTGITSLMALETPFLQMLNVSHNNITEINEKIFERPTLLEVIDISHNKITSFDGNLSKVLSKLDNLHTLDVSSNPINRIVKGDFEGMVSLVKLNISNLYECTKLEKAAFTGLVNLAQLEAYGYPKLGYLDVTGLLHSLPCLEGVDIEIKDPVVGSDQLSSAMNPRLSRLGIRGSRVKSISSSALAGLKSPEVIIEVKDTSITTLPSALFIPLPRSSKIKLDITRSSLKTLTPQFLSALDDRKGDITLLGLSTNPISCDCNARALRRSGFASNIYCQSPEHLAGKKLVEIADDGLTCDPHRPTTTTTSTTTPSTTVWTTRISHKDSDRDIIWSVPPTIATARPPAATKAQTNDDTLIISIVGVVVCFIAVILIVICIVRLKWTDSPPPGGIPPMMPPAHCNNPACPCPKMPPMMPVLPPYAPAYATLPVKRPSRSVSVSPTLRSSYLTLARGPATPNKQQFYVAYPPGEE